MNGISTTATPAEHIDDGALLSLLDDALTNRGEIDRHLAACAACRARLAALSQASSHFARAIGAIQVPLLDARALYGRPIRRTARRPGRRWSAYPAAAAATLLLIASAAAATPVRDWLVRHFRGSVPRVESPLVPTSPAVDAPKPAGRMLVSFAAQDTVLTIRVAFRQAEGSIELVAATSDRISAQVTASAGTEELMISPGELRIRNAASSRASYRVTVPTTVRVIRLIGDEGRTSFERTLAVKPALRERISLVR